jgi:DNA-binding transcriptional regulator WhiA
MAVPWNKGLKKSTHPSVMKTASTMKVRGIDNFKKWRDEMKRLGKIKSAYPPLQKNGDLAELIGVIVGDGNIHAFPRTECLRIVSNSANTGFIKRYTALVKKIFDKTPRVSKRKESNATDIVIYEKCISTRLGIPAGARGKLTIEVPEWIYKNRSHTVRYLRGLYEAEGSIHHHEKTYTHKLLFSNSNESMLRNVFTLLKKLDFTPHRSKDKIQISRKEEVQKLENLLEFRRYGK